ncbi:DUF4956 domain-containing protein [Epulopiscium sp. SCG-B10WGA-EpuloA2]|nr:DUF4956 domain-containing protein [Epulopiscium sp. SCG-B10WGA-EpuloA2]
MNFNDVFKSSFLDNVTAISFIDMTLAVLLSFAIGLFIMAVYKKTYRGIMYSQSFGVALMAMSMITTILILAVTSNVVLSLGMVGALSIVRFRTAIREPLDIAFVFWSIATGIILGAGFTTLAVFGSIIVGLLLFVFVNKKEKDTPYIFIINCVGNDSEKTAMDIIKKESIVNILKSKTVSEDNIELTLELRLGNENTDFVNKITSIDGVKNAILVTYNGDYAG